MTPYELADELDAMAKQFGDKLYTVIANMLRQQADELNKVIPQLVKANGLIENLRIKIAELEKDMLRFMKHYNEMAWSFEKAPIVYWDGKHYADKTKSELADIPLYTTPQTKPLSDEEIDEFIYDLVEALGLNMDCLDEEYRKSGREKFRAIEAKVRGEK
jgi:hypothetical protein